MDTQSNDLSSPSSTVEVAAEEHPIPLAPDTGKKGLALTGGQMAGGLAGLAGVLTLLGLFLMAAVKRRREGAGVNATRV